MSPQRSVVARLTVSLFGNAVRSAVAVISGLVVARALGPADYGGFVFLLATLTVMRQLLDMGSSTAFYTFISQRPRGRRFYHFYAGWQLVQIALVLALVALLLPDWAIRMIWLGHERTTVLLACAATLLQQQVWSIATQIGESRRQTRQVQVAGVYVALLHLLVIWALAHFGLMTQTRLFLLIALEYAVATPLLFHWIGNPAEVDVAEPDWRGIAAEYWRYCRPLVLNSWVGVAYGFADNWLLQRFGGATEQGYFAASSQLSAVTLLATTSLLQIFWKEAAECYHQNNLQRAQQLFDKSIRLLVLISSAAAGFLIPWSGELVHLLLGSSYAASWPVLALMLAFPIHTALGQIVAATYSATNHTRAQANIYSFFMIFSIPVAYVVLAPPDELVLGQGLGSLGLAIKLLAIQIVQVNVLWWWICRSLDWPYHWAIQVILPGLCLALGMLLNSFGRMLWDGSIFYGGLVFIGTLLLFVTSLIGILWRWPELSGISRTQIRLLFKKALGR